MAAKRFYWIKLRDDFFQQKEIKKLRRIAGGDTYVIVYLKMLLLAAKTEGVLTWTGLEDNFAEELALDLDEKNEDVEVTLAYLLKTGLAETKTGETYSLPYVLEVVGSETDSAERMRRMRERQQSQSDALPSRSDGEKEKRERIQDTRDKSESERQDAPRPPTLEEVRAYAFEIGSPVDPERFFDYYQSVGWKTTAGNPIVDWQAKYRSWKDTEREKPSSFETILKQDYGQQRRRGFRGRLEDMERSRGFAGVDLSEEEYGDTLVTIGENGEVLTGG